MIEDAIVIYRLCLVGDSRIKTKDGWKYIKDIEPGDTVYSFWGPEVGLKETKVIKQWKTGIKQTYKVSSKHFDITGSDNHPILVLDKHTNIVGYVDIKDIIPKRHCFVYQKPEEQFNNIEFPKIRNAAIKITNPEVFSNFKIDDKEKYIKTLSEVFEIKHSSVRNFLYGIQYLEKEVAINILDEVGITDSCELDEKYEGNFEKVNINLPEYIDEEFARLYGFLVGDGSISGNRVVFAEGVDEKQNLYYAGLLTKYFGNCNLYKTKRKYNNYTTCSKFASELFMSLEWISGAKNKRIPSWLYKCSNEIKKQFILGLCDADGCNKDSVYTGTWSSEIELSNQKLIEDIKEVWTSIGLTSGKFRYRKRKAEFRTIGDELNPRMMPETESWYVRISDYELPKFENILNVTEEKIEDVYEMEVDSEKHNFVVNGILTHNSRAPERRIFYIDVGNLPKGKAEQYLRDVMVKYRNKMVYDACLSLETKIPLLDGRALSLSEIIEEYNDGKILWAYSCDPKTGKFAPGIISWAGITKKNQKVMKVTLDNGEIIICTPDHKFPTWNNGFVEAKDLVVNESMIPFYDREKKINYSKNKNKYQQIYNNDTKKWEYTHRLVSKWKDRNNIENELVFNEDFTDKKKSTIHHKNYNRFNNIPENLVRMHHTDHLYYHGNNTTFQHISKKELSVISKKGTKALNEKLKDKKFNDEFRKKIKEGWSSELRDRFSEYGKQKPIEHFVLMNKLANESRWNSENSEKNRKKHSEKQSLVYTNKILNEVTNCARKQLSASESVTAINSMDLSEWISLNKNKHIRNRKIVDTFTLKDLTKVCVLHGTSGYKQYKESILKRNHKVLKIEYLNDTMDVGTLTIDREEKYHNYHTFALSAGIYTKNSTGELRDDRKHMAMLEDFWLPRREGGKGTEITTLPAGQNLGELEDVKYFRMKLMNALNVPISRLEPQDGGMIGIGRSTEVTRDEVKFSKFIQRLRIKFSRLFDDSLGLQLALKGVCTKEEWQDFKEDIYYNYKKDNNFTELRDLEIMRERLNSLQLIEPYIGKYYSMDWAKKYVLMQTDEEIERMEGQIEQEGNEGITSVTQDNQNQDNQNQEVNPDQYPPEDNVSEKENTESNTPMLDNEVEKQKKRLMESVINYIEKDEL